MVRPGISLQVALALESTQPVSPVLYIQAKSEAISAPPFQGMMGLATYRRRATTTACQKRLGSSMYSAISKYSDHFVRAYGSGMTASP